MKRWTLSLALGLSACASGAPSTTVDANANVGPAPAAAVELEELPEPQPEPSKPTLVVHEWGTFTARLDAHGNLRQWTKRDRVEPLPKFVFESWLTDAKQSAEGTVRMETPVLYFYAGEPTQVAVEVGFPGGFLTEWFPAAIHEDTAELATLRWPKVELTPGPDPEYPIDGDSHYYAARETDATPLTVHDQDDAVTHEKLLFYRGVGSFELPLAGRMSKAGLELVASRPLTGVIVLSRRGDAIGFEVLESLDGARTVPLPTHTDTLEQLTAEVQRLLVAQGLYEREAAAMIATWRELWFEDGLRVLYMVPRELTDQTLPLTIEPKPDELVRTLVGRLDFPK